MCEDTKSLDAEEHEGVDGVMEPLVDCCSPLIRDKVPPPPRELSSLFLRTDVLAIRCVRDLVFVGMGSMLYLYKHCKFVRKIDCLHPSNVHGIEAGPNNKLAVFGAKSVCICSTVEIANDVRLSKQSIDQFSDWIIAVKWISFNEQMQLAILFAHNYVSIYDVVNKTSQVIYCEESCILYGGSISGTCQENLVIFSGTVFQEILIWKIDTRHDTNKRVPVLHRLTGHKGVIFSVVCDPYSRFICSTSDDRSVRFWKLTEHNNSESNNVNWQTVKIVPIKAMFIHTARVWKALIRNDIVLTIGEDSLICKWSPSGNLLDKIYCKAPMWSIDVSEDNTIYVGGGDGSVYMQPFQNYQSPKISFLPSSDMCNFPKYIAYLHDGAILVFTELGTLLYYNKEMVPKNTIYLAKNQYYIMQVSPNRKFVALASRKGYVLIYKEYLGTLQEYMEKKVINSQIFSLQWLSDNELLACGANGLLKLFQTNSDLFAQYILPPNRERWLTAAIHIHTMSPDIRMLICGDRAGNIHVYSYKVKDFDAPESSESPKDLDIPIKPIQTLLKVHGKMGVQSFDIFQGNLITSGRDGMLRFYQVRADNTKPLLMLHKKKMPMDWISGMSKVYVTSCKQTKKEIVLIFGFKQVEFIIYNLINENIVVRIPCGGGHRSWDCILSCTKTSFTYIKNKQIYLHDLSFSLFSSNHILQNGFHIKETRCLQYISIDNKIFFISGGEDCALRISDVDECRYNFEKYSFTNVGIYNGHLSSIKCISVIQLSGSVFQYLIFSGGGRAQLKIWGLNFDKTHDVYYAEDNQNHDQDRAQVDNKTRVWCSDIYSYMLCNDFYLPKLCLEAKQSCSVEPEIRYMDICAYYPSVELNHVLVFLACADGYLRLLVYDIVTNNIYLKLSTKYVDRCILKINILSHESKVIVLTMSTDGKLRFFDFTDIVLKIYEDTDSGNENIVNLNDTPFAEFSLHQSGINCFDLNHMHEDEYLLITGGDDNLLSVVYFQICITENSKLSAKILSKWSTASAHSAQITGVKFEDGKIYSVGIDQQFIIHNYSYSDGAICADISNQVFTSVTDVQGMVLYSCKLDYHVKCVCIYGRGCEILSIRV